MELDRRTEHQRRSIALIEQISQKVSTRYLNPRIVEDNPDRQTTRIVKQIQELDPNSSPEELVKSINRIFAANKDWHSRLVEPTSGSASEIVKKAREEVEQECHPRVPELIDGRYYYLNLPSMQTTFGRSCSSLNEYATKIQMLLQSLEKPDLEGWVLDLRCHPGGDMRPELCGIAPLLGARNVSGFYDPRTKLLSKWIYQGGKLSRSDLPDWFGITVENGKVFKPTKIRPVAVLQGDTLSSGAAIAAAFRGRKGVRSFGDEAGLANCIEPMELNGYAKGYVLNLSVRWFTDWRGEPFTESIVPPDVTTTAPLIDAIQFLNSITSRQ